MSREPHFLKPVKGDAVPGQFVALAVETTEHDCGMVADVTEHQFKRAAGIFWRYREGKHAARQVRTFNDAAEFWTALYRFARAGSSTWVYAYDAYHVVTLLGIWRKFLTRELIMEELPCNPDNAEPDKTLWRGFCVMSDPPNILICRPVGNYGTLRFLDPRNYGVSDWDSLCRCSTVADDVPQRSESGLGVTDLRCRRHAERVEAFVKNLVAFVKELKLGSLQSTAGSQAINGWRRSYLTHQVHVHDCEEALQLERECYYGGRCECRILGRVYRSPELYTEWVGSAEVAEGIVLDGPIYQYDINSAFPHAASELHLPCRLALYAAEPPPAILGIADKGLSCLADCTIETDEPVYPLRRESEDDVVWPVGRFRTCLPDAEYRHAKERGRVLAVHRFAAYETEPCLRGFVDAMYAARMRYKESGNVGFEEICKRILVAIVGKLVQVNRSWVAVPEFKSQYRFAQFWGVHPVNGKITQWRTFADSTAYLDDCGEHRESLPAIAACITSFVRLRLWEIVARAGHGNVYYYDTDSVWTNRKGSAAIEAAYGVSATELGRLKLAGQYNSVQFFGIKHYQADNTLKCAGFAHAARLGSSAGDRVEEQVSLESFLWSRQLPLARTIRRELKTNRDYRHGVVNRDGTVSPFRVGYVERNGNHADNLQVARQGSEISDSRTLPAS